MIRGVLVLFLMFSSMSAFAARGDEALHWQPSKQGVIRDPQTAITIARAIWISTHPDVKQLIGSEAVWQSGNVATLDKGVWEVSPRNAKGEPEDGVHIFLSQRDGRVLNIFLTQ